MDYMKNISSRLVPSIAILFTLVISGCGTLLDKHVVWEYEEPKNYPIIRAIGYAPINAQPGDSAEIKSIMAMRASKLDAYRELTEQVYGQQIQGQTEMKNLVSSDDKLRSKVSGVIRGARIVKVYPVGDTYATELELDMKLVYELYRINTRSRTIKKVDYY
ncbi:LPP20 family lipoprotein [Psychrosphaera sp. F3M07]|jgi:hypothetical protein|nr:LPP20 family lipoprotein [Psychrosphaera sp. F3M07]